MAGTTAPGTPPAEMWSYIRDLECSQCGEHFPAHLVSRTCTACGKVLFARYDVARARKEWDPGTLAGRSWDLWRYHELLPVQDPAKIVTLGEGMTPLLQVRPPRELEFADGQLFIKDEGINPTGSFKSRGLAVAISRALELGVSEFALPSAGNAGSAAAAYAAAAGVPVHVAVPRDAPKSNLRELEMLGAEVFLVDGLIDAAGAHIRAMSDAHGWFDLSTLKEPYRVEGKKTMGFELAEQGGFGDAALPDVVIYPAGGGTGIVGMWKAFAELEELGWIGSRRPRMVVVQAAGCAPIVQAFVSGADHADPWVDGHTMAAGIRVPSAIGDYLILRAIRESAGTAITVTDEDMVSAQGEMARATGVLTSLEGAATYAALKSLRSDGYVSANERVVLFATALGIK